MIAKEFGCMDTGTNRNASANHIDKNKCQLDDAIFKICAKNTI